MKSKKMLMMSCVAVLSAVALSSCGTQDEAGPSDSPTVASEETTESAAVQDNDQKELTLVEITGNCLKERGWNVQINVGQQQISAQYHDSQHERFQADYEECSPTRELIERPFSAISEEELQHEYDALTEIQECLAAAGYAVPPDKPSYESWKASMREGTPTWDPYSEANTFELNQQQREAMFNKCPDYGGYLPAILEH